MAETLTVTVDDGGTYTVDVHGVDLFTDAGLTTPATFPTSIAADTTWYAAAHRGARAIHVKITNSAGGVMSDQSGIASLPFTFNATEGGAGTASSPPSSSGGSIPVPAVENALQPLRVNAEGNGFEFVPGMPDYATWHREGAGDGATGGFNYDTDMTASHGTTITFDDSTAWVNAYGYPIAQVTEAGTYFFRLRNQVPTGTPTPNMSFYDANAAPLTVPQWLAGLAGSGGTAADWIASIYLPAGAHFEASYGSTMSDLTVSRSGL